MRTFVSIRQYLLDTDNTVKELNKLKKQIRSLSDDVEGLVKDQEMYDDHLTTIYQAIAELSDRNKQHNKPRPKVGFNIDNK